MINFILIIRDIMKLVLRVVFQVYVRIFCVNRKMKSSIALNARLDFFDLSPKNILKRKKRNMLEIGEKSYIEEYCVLNMNFGDVIIKQNTGVGIGSIIIGPVEVGDNSRISQYCFITGENRVQDIENNKLSDSNYDVKPVHIGDGVWIGAEAIILPGITIGNNSIIGAGSVVTKNVPENTLVVGNPAIVIKQLGK